MRCDSGTGQNSVVRKLQRPLQIFLLLALCLLLGGCARWAASVSARMSSNLSQAVLNQNDLETVRAGAPAYLLLIEGLLESDPTDKALLRSAADLYGAYTSLFVRDPGRALRLSARSLNYAERALCSHRRSSCDSTALKYADFVRLLESMQPGDLPFLYSLGTAWAGWIQVRREDWNAVAQIPQVEALMTRATELDEGYSNGGAYLYLGTLKSMFPPALGGKPELGRQYFERAIELSRGRNLMAKVLYARHYARLVFNRALHDRLLNEVIVGEADSPGLTLINTLAQRQAVQLLQESEEYF